MGRKKKADDTSARLTGDNAGNEAASGKVGILKTKLRKKFVLLKDEPLDFDNLDKLKDHVCMVLGMDRPKLDWIIEDL